MKYTIVDKSDPLLDTEYAKILTHLHSDVLEANENKKNTFNNSKYDFLRQLFVIRKINIDSQSNQNKFHSIVAMLDPDDSNVTQKSVENINKELIDSINDLIMHDTTLKKGNLALNEEEKAVILIKCQELKDLSNSVKNYNDAYSDAFKGAKKEWLVHHWNATVLTAGAGWVLNSIDNKWSSLNTQLFKFYFMESVNLESIRNLPEFCLMPIQLQILQ